MFILRYTRHRNMFYQTIQYIKFLLKSTNQHGVHSPFVYNLVTQCFYKKTYYKAYDHIISYKKQLLENKTKIKVLDLGAGSHTMKHQERYISDMAKHAGSTNKNAKMLYRFINYYKPSNILELGTSLGIATHAMSLGHPKAKITTIEGCPNISQFTKTVFNKNGLENINIITGEFNTIIKTLQPVNQNLVFFDGNHQKEATLNYFEVLLTSTNNDSIFIFDDIHWSKGMTEAWNIIKQHPKVTVTIDTFYWGFVFFRKEQAKEHFTIRI